MSINSALKIDPMADQVAFENEKESEIFELEEEHLDEENNLYSCEVLDFEENNISDNEEIGIALINTRNGFSCKDCPKVFASHKRFLTHIKQIHHVDIVRNTRKLSEHEEVVDAEGTIVFRCKICTAEFEKRKGLLLHLQIHKNVENAKNKKTIQNPSILNCDLCNRSFNSQSALKMHLKAHDEKSSEYYLKKTTTAKETDTKKTKGSHPCQYCGKLFTRPHEKVKHERVHTNEKPFACDICGKKFRVTYCLSLHKRNVHSDERPYVCTMDGCTKRFKAPGAYNHHLKTHSSETNYVCPYEGCKKAFKTSVQLAGHKKMHSKPFTCEHCQRPFAALYAARAHMEICKTGALAKHICDYCGASYARAFALTAHVDEAHKDELIEVIIEEEVIDS